MVKDWTYNKVNNDMIQNNKTESQNPKVLFCRKIFFEAIPLDFKIHVSIHSQVIQINAGIPKIGNLATKVTSVPTKKM